jgi:cobalamin biosynthesis Mg chelatase CobN
VECPDAGRDTDASAASAAASAASASAASASAAGAAAGAADEEEKGESLRGSDGAILEEEEEEEEEEEASVVTLGVLVELAVVGLLELVFFFSLSDLKSSSRSMCSFKLSLAGFFPAPLVGG